MARTKKRYVRSNLGGAVRPEAEAPRRRFLYTDVTKAEYEKILQYCRTRQISISQFLADLVLEDAAKTPRQDKVVLKLEVELTPEEQDRLELLTRLHQKQSIDHFVRELLEPNLKMQRVHSPLKTRMLRFYLSDEEHELVSAHIASTGISARNYAAMLALREIGKTSNK